MIRSFLGRCQDRRLARAGGEGGTPKEMRSVLFLLLCDLTAMKYVRISRYSLRYSIVGGRLEGYNMSLEREWVDKLQCQD